MGYFNFIKFDKLDKIVIAFTFVIVSIFSIFNFFCFASETVDIQLLDNARISSSNIISTSDIDKLYYFPIQKGFKYSFTLKNLSGNNLNLRTGFTDVVEIGQTVSSSQQLTVVDSYSIVINADNYDENFYVAFPYPVESLEFSCEKFPIQSMSSSIYSLVDNVGPGGLWSIFEKSLPFVLIIVVSVFGIYLITRMIKGLSKGKGRL